MLRKVEPNNLGCDVRVEGGHIAVTGLSLDDAELAAYVGDQPEVDRPAVVERGLKVGLIALRNAGVTVNVDFVAREFERLMHRTDESHDRAAAALGVALRESFGSKD
jgi:riboflavin synthase alpha subunit